MVLHYQSRKLKFLWLCFVFCVCKANATSPATRTRHSRNKHYRYVYKYREPFPYKRHTFHLRRWPDEKVRRLLRFNKTEIEYLAQALHLEDVPYRRRLSPSPTMALCVVLYRLSRPHRLIDACSHFGRSDSWLSTVFNDVTMFLDRRYSGILRWHPMLNDFTRLKLYAEAIYNRGGQGDKRIWGFIDGTFRGFSRSSDNDHQRRMYSGYYKGHGMKWQAIVTPDGLISSLCGPWPGPANDWTMMIESGIIDDFRRVFTNQEPMYIYGDPAYTHAFGIMGPYLHPNGRHGLDEDEYEFNRALASVRIAVEHAFGHIARQWTFTAFPQGMKEGSSPVACYFSSAVLLINCFKCFRGSQTSDSFVYQPPSIDEYLAGAVE